MSHCQTCGDTGFVFTSKAGETFPHIRYWIFYRCTCDAGSPGSWKVTVNGKTETVTGMRKWDRTIKTYAEANIPRCEVFAESARIEVEQEEWEKRREERERQPLTTAPDRGTIDP